MALFGSQRRPASLPDCVKLVESVVQDLGLDPGETRLPDDDNLPIWGVMKGSAEVYVRLYSAEDDHFVEVMSPVASLPIEERPELYRRLLEVNGYELSGVAFGLRNDRIILSVSRPITGLDREELHDMIVRVGTCADQIDDLLATEYRVRRHTDI